MKTTSLDTFNVDYNILAQQEFLTGGLSWGASEPLPPYPEGQYDYSFAENNDYLYLTYTSGFKAPRYRIVNGELLIDYDGAEPDLTINENGELIATY